MSRSTLWRRVSGLLEVQLEPVLLSTPSDIIQLDGFYLSYPSIKRNRHRRGAKKRSCILLWALDGQTGRPLYWRFYDQLENPGVWKDFIGALANQAITPDYVIHDGHPGITQAVNQYWPRIRQQRCLVHLMGNMHKDLGIAPRTRIARELKQTVAALFHVQDADTWADWQKQWLGYCDAHHETLQRLRAREAVDEDGVRVPGALLDAYTVVANAYQRLELSAYLDDPATIARTTNAIESLNGNLRELLRRHRGMSLERRINLVSWYLGIKQRQSRAQLKEQVHTHFDT